MKYLMVDTFADGNHVSEVIELTEEEFLKRLKIFFAEFNFCLSGSYIREGFSWFQFAVDEDGYGVALFTQPE